MKYFFAFCLFSLITSQSTVLSQKAFQLRVKGGYKTCIEYEYSYDFKSKNIISLSRYNSLGIITAKIKYDDKGLYNGKEIFKYDSIGNMIETISYNSHYSIDWRKNYYYDINNNFIKGIVCGKNGLTDEIFIIQYDSLGFMKKAINYRSDSIDFYIIFYYNTDGNLSESIQYNFDGSIFSKNSNKYDSNCNIIESSTVYSDSSFSYKIVYYYDTNCNLMNEIGYNLKNEQISKTEYIYSKKGLSSLTLK